MIDKVKANPFFRKILIFILRFVSVVNPVLPKNKRKILLYDSGRNYLDDNTEALYNYLINNGYDEKYKICCCVPREKPKTPFSYYKPVGAIRGVFEYVTSMYVFFSFGDFRIHPSKNQVVVNQWHGSPLKRIGKLTYDKNYQLENLDNFTFLLAASDFFVPIMAKAFNCVEDKIKVLGNTRNDYLFFDKDALTPLGIDRNAYNKLLLWMPTFRKSNDQRFSDGNTNGSETMLPILEKYSELEELDAYLVGKKILLVLKIHPLALFKSNNYENIFTITNDDLMLNGVKLYEFVKEFDALITDYSSIVCDYLLLNRPIGFTMDDYEQYAGNRGFVVDNLRDYLPGHHMYIAKDVYSFVSDIINDVDIYRHERVRVNILFNKYCDSNNCMRLADMVGIKK